MMKLLFCLLLMMVAGSCLCQKASFKVLVLYENGAHHTAFSARARLLLDSLAADSGFAVTYINDTKTINDSLLAVHQLFIQLDYPPFNWTKEAAAAFEKYISEGKCGGWIGFHHATLLGNFEGFKLWQWFSNFMGGIEFKGYIAEGATAKVYTEDSIHPVMKGVPNAFTVDKEEWYTYNKTPRPNVKVLASVDEASYTPPSNIVMGDHPVIWTNTAMKARNVYIYMGHSPQLFNNTAYTTLFKNAIFWAVKR